MRIIWRRDSGIAECGGKEFVITSITRNELNGRRRLHEPSEVVNIVTRGGRWGQAYMPRQFPTGTWKIVGVEKTSEPVFAPVKIKTDAHQNVELWNLDSHGGYDRPSGIFAEDWGYHLHWSENSKTTLGCGRVGTDTNREALELAGLVSDAMAAGKDVILEVV
jgi:hypothetical protein